MNTTRTITQNDMSCNQIHSSSILLLSFMETLGEEFFLNRNSEVKDVFQNFYYFYYSIRDLSPMILLSQLRFFYIFTTSWSNTFHKEKVVQLQGCIHVIKGAQRKGMAHAFLIIATWRRLREGGIWVKAVKMSRSSPGVEEAGDRVISA